MLPIIKSYLRPLYVPMANWYHKRFKGPRRYRYLFETIREVHPKSILEVGTWNGNRSLQMIKLAQTMSPGGKIVYYGFDLFEEMTDALFAHELSKRPPAEADVCEKLTASGAEIRLYKGDSKIVLPKAILEIGKVDFVFIDGGHHVETIQSDWENVAKLMHERTVVIFDDYWRNRTDAGCKAVVDAIDQDKYMVEVLPVVDSFNNEFGRLNISFARVRLR